MVFHNNVWLMMILALSVSKQKVQEWFSVVVLSYQKGLTCLLHEQVPAENHVDQAWQMSSAGNL
jgi:hypothetical protein